MRTKEEIKERIKKVVSRPYFPYGITGEEGGELKALLWVLELEEAGRKIPFKDLSKWIDGVEMEQKP